MKKITIVWTIILIIIVGGLTAIGLKFKKDNIDNWMEEELVKQSQKFLGYYVSRYPSKGESIKLTYDELKSDGYDAKLEKECDGYVIVSNKNNGYTYDAFVKCADYTTDGYTENE